MKVTINGEPTDLPEGATILQMLECLKLTTGRVAVEVNREIVTRSRHETTTLNPGDTVEIVTLVGGG
jgi:thiamine biosynthesis protein ThiS